MFDSIHLMKPEYLFRKNDENCLLNTSGIYFFFMLEFSQHSSITENVTVMTFGQDVKVSNSIILVITQKSQNVSVIYLMNAKF